MMRRFVVLLVLFFGAARGDPAHAAITYQYITDQSHYNATAGQSVTVKLFLQETLSGGSTSLIVDENGLYGASVFVTRSGTVPADPATISGPITANRADPPAGFGTLGNVSQVPATTTTAGLVENVGSATSGPLGSLVNSSIRQVFLGTLTLIAGGTGSSTQFTIESYKAVNGVDGNTITYNNFYDLDLAGGDPSAPQSFTGADAFTNTFSVDVTGAPEPGTLLLTGFAALVMAGGAWRRRKAQTASAETPVREL